MRQALYLGGAAAAVFVVSVGAHLGLTSVAAGDGGWADRAETACVTCH